MPRDIPLPSRYSRPEPVLILGRERGDASEPLGFARPPERGGCGLITYGGDGHLMTISPTGGGKTSGPVITNALTWPGQLVAIDVKGEIAAATAERRSRFGPVHIIDLRDNSPNTDSLNPIDLFAVGTNDLAVLCRSIAAILVDRTGAEDERFWTDWGESLLTAVIGFVLRNRDEKNLAGVFDLLHQDDFDYWFAGQMDNRVLIPDGFIRKALTPYLALPSERTRPCVYGSAIHPMRLFDAPTIRNLTSSTSFDIADLIDGKPMSLYFVVPPFRLQAYAPVIRLWLSALMAAFSTRPVDHRRKTLLLIDEIGNLGRMDEFVTAATLMRGWGVTLWSFWQSFSQLHQYGHNAQVLADNAGVIQLFSPRNYRTAKEFCDLVGGITPEAVMALRPDEQLLLIEGGQPRVARKVQYFRDPEFSRLVTANNAVR